MNEDRKKALDLVRIIVAEEMDANVNDIDEDTTLSGDLDMTKDNLHQVLAACEVEFDVKFEGEDYEMMHTVEDIVNSLDEWYE